MNKNQTPVENWYWLSDIDWNTKSRKQHENDRKLQNSVPSMVTNEEKQKKPKPAN